MTMKNNFSRQVKEALSISMEEAVRLGSDCIGTGHLLLALIRQDHSPVVAFLENYRVELPELKREAERAIEAEKGKTNTVVPEAGIFKLFPIRPRNGKLLDRQAERVIRESVQQAKEAKSQTVEAEHLMLSILKERNNIGTQVLGRFGVDYNHATLHFRQSHSN
jgi:ATP-dependent Clp protease ATP-binding subunit ClpC